MMNSGSGVERNLSLKNTFGNDTLVRRLPKMLDSLIEERDWDSSTGEKLRQIHTVFPYGHPVFFQDAEPTREDWNRFVLAQKETTFMEASLLFSECYFYRLLLEKTGFFIPGSTYFHSDPFAHKKESEFKGNQAIFEELCARYTTDILPGGFNENSLKALFHLNLIGNQADLSINHPGQEERGLKNKQLSTTLLVDDFKNAVRLFDKKMNRIDIITDNAGLELFCDFLMADYFLQSSIAEKVVFNLKPYPIFVSDATFADVAMLLDFLLHNREPGLIVLGYRIRKFMDAGRIITTGYADWNLPVCFRGVKPELLEGFKSAGLVISKGDLNYRRFFDDLLWQAHAKPAQIMAYFPAPVLFIRVIKSDVLAADKPLDQELMTRAYFDWQSRPYGVIQLV